MNVSCKSLRMRGVARQASRPRAAALRAALLVLPAVLLTHAAAAAKPDDLRDKTPEEIRREGQKVFSPGAGGGERPPGAGGAGGAGDKKETGDEAATGGDSWVIAICLYTGDEHAEVARIACEHVQREGGLPGAFTQPRGKGTLVAYGRFDGPEDPRAQAELKRLHEMKVKDETPYALVWLAPPPVSSKVKIGSMPQFELRQAKAYYGDHALYTLQVGVYGRRDLDKPTEKDLADARKAAEAAVVELRQAGEEAFYYHGPTMSTVTVGVFDESDFDPQVPSYQSTRLREAKRLHPYNLYNGQAIKVKKKMGDRVVEQIQPSGLVAVPEK